MADKDKKPENRALFRSAYGTIVPGSMTETEKFVEVRIQQGPNPENAGIARAYKDDAKAKLKEAAASSEPVLLRGQLLGSKAKNNVHLAINSVNEPRLIEGKVSNVRHSDPSKQAFVAGFMVIKGTKADGSTYSLPRPFRAFGEAAQSLAGLKAGDSIQGGAREAVQRREKNGDVEFQEIFELVGSATINGKALDAEKPAAAPKADEDQMDREPFPGNNDWDDEIPF